MTYGASSRFGLIVEKKLKKFLNGREGSHESRGDNEANDCVHIELNRRRRRLLVIKTSPSFRRGERLLRFL